LGRFALPRRGTSLGVVAVIYIGWVLLGQNPDHARHLLPLVPLAVLGIAPVVRRFSVLAVAVAALVVAAPVHVERAAELPPSLQAMQWVAAHHSPDQLQLYTGSEARLFMHYAPAYRATRVTTAHDVMRDLRERGGRPNTVLVTSTAGDLSALRPRLVEVARFDRAGSPQLTVYTLTEDRP